MSSSIEPGPTSIAPSHRKKAGSPSRRGLKRTFPAILSGSEGFSARVRRIGCHCRSTRPGSARPRSAGPASGSLGRPRKNIRSVSEVGGEGSSAAWGASSVESLPPPRRASLCPGCLGPRGARLQAAHVEHHWLGNWLSLGLALTRVKICLTQAAGRQP